MLREIMGKRGTYLHKNFILRITREEWLRQVFTIKKYYPGVPRRWERGGLIFLARRSDRGDSFVGYGVVGRFIEKDDLKGVERQECERMRWRGVIIFDELYRFEPPLPLKETSIAGLKAKGKCLHGYPLTEEQAAEILEAASNLCSIIKV
ncbi:MAG: hypothetical protein QW600_03090 [Candidatus Bathyarchaeia archaeon]